MSDISALKCKHLGCRETRHGYPGSEHFCPFHAAARYEQVRSKPNEKPIVLWCPEHGSITTPIQPYASRTARLNHARAGCGTKIQTFVLDVTR